MKVKSVEDAQIVLDLPGILGQILHTKENLEIVHLEIEPGKSIADHELPLNVIFFVIEGVTVFTVDSEETVLNRNQYIEVKPNQRRSTRNDSDEVARILVIKQNTNI